MTHYRRDFLRLLEAALIGLFFVQAIRFLYGTLYAHLSSASLVERTVDVASLNGRLGVVPMATAELELMLVGGLLLLPLLYFIFYRLWFGPTFLAILVAVGRVFMTDKGMSLLGVAGAAVCAGAALLYIATVAVRRPTIFPYLFIFGFAIDHLVRLYGNTLDITSLPAFIEEQTILSLVLCLLAVLTVIFERLDRSEAEPRGEITGWGGLALGGLLFLHFAIFGLSNTLAHRAGLDYISLAPWLLVAMLLPIVPQVRETIRQFVSMFDPNLRGWIWLLLSALLIILGFRLSGPLAGAVLVITEFFLSLSWWWIVQPKTSRVNLTGLVLIIGVIVFLLLSGADFFTFEYAFVGDLQASLANLLRSLRGMGLAVVLLALLLSCMPAILGHQRPPWRGADATANVLAVGLLLLAGLLGYSLARPVVSEPVNADDPIRVATLNLHGGYSLYYGMDLAELSQRIQSSGANVVLLQEVETGRLVSYGVDQAAWLGRTLGMQVAYFSTNESLQGLAVLSKLPMEQANGVWLTSRSKQTGVQYVRIRLPNENKLDVYNAQLSVLVQSSTLPLEAQQQEQSTQIQEILAYIAQNRSLDPNLILVLGGTFNHAPDSQIYVYLSQQGYLDPFADQRIEDTYTLQRINNPPARVDYLWMHCQPAECLKGVVHVPMTASSHNLIGVELLLPKPQ